MNVVLPCDTLTARRWGHAIAEEASAVAAMQAAGYSGCVLTAGEDDDFQVVELWEAVTAASVLTPREVYTALAGGQQPRVRERRRALGFRAVLADSHVCLAGPITTWAQSLMPCPFLRFECRAH